MATPMTAGTAALVKEAHPNWNGAQIKAAIMNTADATLNTGYNVRRAGAGVVQAQKAVNSTVLATTIDNLTPGSSYVFQVRALGKLGYTDWSDSMTFICA